MLGFFRSFGRVSPTSSPRSSARPRLEILESRWTPDGNGNETIGPILGGGNGGGGTGGGGAPNHTLTLSIEYGWGRTITLSGALSGCENVSGVEIDISGKADGSTSTDENGNYSITLTGEGLGRVYAVAMSECGASAYDDIWDEPPVVTSFTVTEGANHTWVFSGTITYHRPFNTMAINFGGVPVSVQGGGTSANGSGSFEWFVTLNGTASDNGQVWATATSPWGLVSEKAYQNVHQTGT